jgi:hypothetical protein
MSAAARTFDFASRIVTILAAILLAIPYAAIAGSMGALIRIGHRDSLFLW